MRVFLFAVFVVSVVELLRVICATILFGGKYGRSEFGIKTIVAAVFATWATNLLFGG